MYTESHSWRTIQEGTAKKVLGQGTGNFLARVDWKFLESQDPVFRRHVAVVVVGPSMWISVVVSQVTINLTCFPVSI